MHMYFFWKFTQNVPNSRIIFFCKFQVNRSTGLKIMSFCPNYTFITYYFYLIIRYNFLMHVHFFLKFSQNISGYIILLSCNFCVNLSMGSKVMIFCRIKYFNYFMPLFQENCHLLAGVNSSLSTHGHNFLDRAKNISYN